MNSDQLAKISGLTYVFFVPFVLFCECLQKRSAIVLVHRSHSALPADLRYVFDPLLVFHTLEPDVQGPHQQIHGLACRINPALPEMRRRTSSLFFVPGQDGPVPSLAAYDLRPASLRKMRNTFSLLPQRHRSVPGTELVLGGRLSG